MFTLVLSFIHISSGTIALICGFLALLTKNQLHKHRSFGKLYKNAMAIVVFTAFPLAIIRPNIFLFCIAIFSGYLSFVGVRTIMLKSLKLQRLDQCISASVLLTSSVSIITLSLNLYTVSRIEFKLIALTFASIGFALSFSELALSQLIWKPLGYIGKHQTFINSALTATSTAALVTLSNYIPIHPLLAWLGPTIIVIPIITYNNFKRALKLGKK